MIKIAIIPARSGSKGLKNKNILDICGKPMIAYSIEAAMKTNIFDRVIVSTDSKEYGRIAEEYGAEVIYRDERLSNDCATTYMVVEDVISRIKNEIDYFVLLQPTSPLRDSNHILNACRLFEKNINKFDFLVSVKEAKCSSILIKKIEDDNSLKYFDTDFSNYKRQNYKEYSPNGAIFIGKQDKYMQKKHFFGAKSYAFKMNYEDSIDIDNWMDYELAKICMKKKMEEADV